MTPPTHNSSQRRLGFKRRSMWYALVKDLSASYYSLVILARKNIFVRRKPLFFFTPLNRCASGRFWRLRNVAVVEGWRASVGFIGRRKNRRRFE